MHATLPRSRTTLREVRCVQNADRICAEQEPPARYVPRRGRTAASGPEKATLNLRWNCSGLQAFCANGFLEKHHSPAWIVTNRGAPLFAAWCQIFGVDAGASTCPLTRDRGSAILDASQFHAGASNGNSEHAILPCVVRGEELQARREAILHCSAIFDKGDQALGAATRRRPFFTATQCYANTACARAKTAH